MRAAAPGNKVLLALEDTGFILEHKVALKFQEKKWATINGRYYLDDVDGRARELDLIAYKVKKDKEIDVATVVLVSCKKDAKNTVAFMSRGRPKKDPNADREPVHWWTRAEPLRSYLASEEWKGRYVESSKNIKDKLLSPQREIFAFQLVSESGAPQNDKPIFDSVICLMKAMDHEINRFDMGGKGKRRIYQFVLCTIFDAPMVDAQYEHAAPRVIEVSHILYFSQYIVSKKDRAALVHFVRWEGLEKFLDDLGALHEHNASFFKNAISLAYSAVKTSSLVRKYFSENLSWEFKFKLNDRLRKLGRKKRINKVSFEYYGDKLVVSLDLEDSESEILNRDGITRDEVAALLKKTLRYAGEFSIEEDLPF
ncbi:hypothetical protein [Xanthomonas sacchari]|uniref:hypothetical protein n=1 Tax=Xanthomonas sacchari TaxID=56458 RepID=UPI002257D911|nr:hypothetical protein [Xanthomonas sacchari]MCW0402192.1 hypothetical protein [Xanthomonas sacchari]MCW0414252.1 hypothetical protein [Xanthomonas sacchari]MCW0436383.1 hypothetical protein [Xanthomonas sacchari]